MRPSSLRRDRQNQFNYLTQQEHEEFLRQQIEQKKQLQHQEKLQNQQEIINHYKNYQLGADQIRGETSTYMQDLDQLVRNKERELDRSRQAPLPSGIGATGGGLMQSNPFQGDMNEFARQFKTNIGSSGQQFQGFDKPQQSMMPTGGEGISSQLPIAQRNNENMNIINGIFGGGNPGPTFGQQNMLGMGVQQSHIQSSAVAESERERRLKLRDLERMKRLEGFSGGDYGQLETSAPSMNQVQPVPAIFGGPPSQPNSAQSKRDQIWQQKMQQRISSQENPYRANLQTQEHQVNIHLPVNQASLVPLDLPKPPSSSEAQLRSSRAHKLSDAIRLDQSLNYQDYQNLQNQQANPPSIQNQKAPPTSNPLLGGDDELIKRRREVERNQRQKEYQEYMAKQNKGNELLQQKPISVGQSNAMVIEQYPSQLHQMGQQEVVHSSSSQRSKEAASSSVLQVAGGMNLLGMHQLKKEEEKLRLQREYKQYLDHQAAQKEDKDQQHIGARRKELSDQVFSEILGNPVKPSLSIEQPSIINQTYDQRLPSQGSAKSANQPGEFFKLGQSEEDRKRLEFEKKRQYALQLQEQMAQQNSQASETDNRKRRGGSVRQQAQQQQVPQQDFAMPNKVFDYQGVAPFIPQFPMQYQNMGMQQPVPQQYQNDIQGFMPQQIQPQGFLPPQLNQPSSIATPQQYIIQPPVPLQNQPLGSIDNKDQQLSQQRTKQEEYRNFLNEQVRLKEQEKKLKEEQERLLQAKEAAYASQKSGLVQPVPSSILPLEQPSQPQQFAYGMPQQQTYDQPSAAPNFQRQQTEVLPPADDNVDRKSRQQKYQEELKAQMEESKRRKEEEILKQKIEDQRHEERMKEELERLRQAERSQLKEEGREIKEERKRNVRRDQFEPSSDNPIIKATTAVITQAAQPKQSEQQWQQPSSLPQINQPSFELPVNNRREELFGGQNQQTSSGPQFQIQQRPPTFDPSIQSQQRQSYQSYEYPQVQQQPIGYGNQQPTSNDYQATIQDMQLALKQVVDFRKEFLDDFSQMKQQLQIEREQIINYERQKQEQQEQLSSLRALQDRLASMVQQAQYQGHTLQNQLDPRLQHDLSHLLHKQQQEILRLSQSGRAFRQPSTYQLPQPQLASSIQYQSQVLPSYNQTMQKPQYLQQSYHFQQENYQHVKPHPPHATHLEASPSEGGDILEQSLNSKSKFMAINSLGQQIMKPQQADGHHQQQPLMMQTWNEEQMFLATNQFKATDTQKAYHESLLAQSLQGSSQLVAGGNNTLNTSSKMINITSPQKQINLVGNVHRPQSTIIQEIIQELPSHQEDDSKLDDTNSLQTGQRKPVVGEMIKIQNNHPLRRQPEEENDFNSRESSQNRAAYNEDSRPYDLAVAEDTSYYHHDTSYKNHNNVSKLSDNSTVILHQQQLPQLQKLQPSQQHHPNLMMTVDSNPLANTNTIQANMAEIDFILGRGGQQQQPVKQNAAPPSLSMPNDNYQYDRTNAQRSELKQVMSPTGSSIYQKTQQKTQERFNVGGATGSSFYNATMHLQKQQEQSQQEELQKQLARIYGAGTTSIETTNKDDAKQQKVEQQQYQLPTDSAEQQPRVVTQQQAQQMMGMLSLKSNDEDLLMQTNINIADSVNEDTQKQIIHQISLVKKLQNPVITHNPKPSTYSAIAHIDQQDPEEVVMNDRPTIQATTNQQFDQTTKTNLDIWNDPDLVSPHLDEVQEEEQSDMQHQQPDFEDDYGHYGEYGAQQNDQYCGVYQSQEYDNMMQMVPPGGFTNTSLNAQTINQLQMFSPPSNVDEQEYGLPQMECGTIDNDDSRINLGTYNHDHFNQELEEQKQRVQNSQKIASSSGKRLPMSAQSNRRGQEHETKPFSLGYENERKQQVQQVNSGFDEEISEHELTSKEKDLLEINKLIQKATNTANNLLENTDNFKFRFKKDHHEQPEGVRAPTSGSQRPQSSKLQPNVEERSPKYQHDNDTKILSKLDMILQNLQDQQTKSGAPPLFRSFTRQKEQEEQQQESSRIQIANNDFEDDNYSEDQVHHPEQMQQTQEFMTGANNNKIYHHQVQRPLSSVGEKKQLQQQSSQLGKFAQMANIQDEQMIEEVSKKYGAKRSGSNGNEDTNSQANKQVILRPVSGKSNSNRYSQNVMQRNASRSGDRKQLQPQLYYDDENDEQQE